MAALAACAVFSACILREPKAARSERNAPVSPSTRFARLTHAQWANSVRDLVGLSELELEHALRGDPRPNGFAFDNYAASLSVDEALSRDYQRAAAEVAALASADPGILQRLLPPSPEAARSRAEKFVRSFGLRAHRRPLTEAEIGAYLDLWSQGQAAYPAMPALEAGVRLVLAAMLQSPHFTYRIVAGSADALGRIELDAHELAARLSYTLWNTLPDAALLARAETGELSDPRVLREVAQDMLRSDRGKPLMASFHAQLFERERLLAVSPSRDRFPQLSEDFAQHAAREADLFISHQIAEADAGFSDLMTSHETFVNAELASLYGLPGQFSSDFTKVALDPSRRRGMLTQVAFLAAHATSTDPDPIHRGVFVARRLLCKPLSAPGNLPPLPAAAGRTNRQTVEAHTEAPGSGCAVCHQRTINPLGFPFEMYDAIGRERATDNGLPVETSTVPTIDERATPVNDAVELATRVAESQAAHACYVRHWLEYAYGRPALPSDEELIEQLGTASKEKALSVNGIVLELVTAPQFRVLEEKELL